MIIYVSHVVVVLYFRERAVEEARGAGARRRVEFGISFHITDVVQEPSTMPPHACIAHIHPIFA